MLLIIGTVRLPAAGLEAAKSSMSAMIAESRLEDGCIDYVYAEDVLEKGLIHVKEMWRDRAALDQHFQSAHLAQWRSSWERLGVFDRRLALYDVGDAQAI